MDFERLQRFFRIWAGTPVEVIEKYPTEHSKFLGIGATIFFTALFAGLSGGYAPCFVFSGSPAVWFAAPFFGILCGLAIFNIDRYIVSSIKKTSKGMKQFYQASPRLVLAILIARPLELKIFDKEIRDKLKAEVFGSRTGTTSGISGYGSYAKGKDARLAYLSRELSLLQEFLTRQKAAEGGVR